MDPLLNPETSLNDFCHEITVLQDLARQGSWRSMLEKIAQARKLSVLQKPHEHLTYLAYNVLALAKLRRYGEAAEELETIGDFEDPKYRYESHAYFYNGKSGSMVPFSLRWLHAEIPHRLGRRQETLDRLYKLLDFVEHRIAMKKREQKTDIQLVGSANKPSSGLKSETLEKVPEKILKAPETQETPQGAPSPAVPFPFTSSKEGGVVAVNPVETSESGISGDVVLETSEHLGDGVDEGIAFESLKLDESNPAETAPRNPADRMRVGQGSDAGHKSNALDEDFGEFVASKASQGSKTEGQFEFSALWRWQRREDLVINSILRHHLSQKDYITSMKWLERLLERDPLDPFLLSKVGYLQLQMGDLSGAKTTFSRIEAMVEKGNVFSVSSSEVLKNLVNRNRALEHLVAKDYTSAVREYEEAMDRDPADVVATNNKALCLMYSRDLLGSIKVLENALERVPVLALNENVVLNLCSMYELAFVNNVETKRTLSSWIVQIAPEDFDLSCTRL
uniref:Uncharacterized protein n=1 Tax=Araucaria cunninghamii TaxID=56994 RepID=A0A0D6QW34_ARACU